ncbi:putative antigenic protein [Trypanosoma rangeli]|uniref:Putative antigenic protein n=1 Tax=Trypanosoma rangeli TaxID=5698 RepID=A0A422N8D2_TRYRA|nr:putative antigenic protein [Trypanosoma rangeli]RNF01734.1 putative antigenic protein [Trypanosoma rangeli]|eukprot:RNF01734.1 putative antigenic protein [Trypanosoma rangeli]
MLVESAPRRWDNLPLQLPMDVISVGSLVAFEVLKDNSWCYETGNVTFLSEYIARVSVSYANPGVGEKEQLEMDRRYLGELCGMLQRLRVQSAKDHEFVLQNQIEHARLQVRGIEAACLREVQSYQKPPPTVKCIMDDVMEILGIRPESYSWSYVKAVTKRTGFVSLVAEFDSSKVSAERRLEILQRCRSREVSNKAAYKASQAAGPLHLWVLTQLNYFETCDSPTFVSDSRSREQQECLLSQIKALQRRIRCSENGSKQPSSAPLTEEKTILRSCIISPIPTTCAISRIAAMHRPELLEYVALHHTGATKALSSSEPCHTPNAHGELQTLREKHEKEHKQFKPDGEKAVKLLTSEIGSLSPLTNPTNDNSRLLQQPCDWDMDNESSETKIRRVQGGEQQTGREEIMGALTEMLHSIRVLERVIAEPEIDKKALKEHLNKVKELNGALKLKVEGCKEGKASSYIQQELETLLHNEELRNEIPALKDLNNTHKAELVEARLEAAHPESVVTTLSAESLMYTTPTISTHHTISIDGDAWEAVLGNCPQKLLRELTCEATACCGAHAECVSAITRSHGKLQAQFRVTHSADRSSEDIDHLLSLCTFHSTRSLWKRQESTSTSSDTGCQKSVLSTIPLAQDNPVTFVQRGEMDELLRHNEHLQALLKDSRRAEENLQAELAMLRVRNSEYQRDVAEKQREIAVLQATLDEATSKEADAQSQLAQQRRTVEHLQNELSALRNLDNNKNVERYEYVSTYNANEADVQKVEHSENSLLTHIEALYSSQKEPYFPQHFQEPKTERQEVKPHNIERLSHPHIYIQRTTEKNILTSPKEKHQLEIPISGNTTPAPATLYDGANELEKTLTTAKEEHSVRTKHTIATYQPHEKINLEQQSMDKTQLHSPHETTHINNTNNRQQNAIITTKKDAPNKTHGQHAILLQMGKDKEAARTPVLGETPCEHEAAGMQRGRDGPRRWMKRPQSTPSGGHRLQWSVDALQRRNDDLRAQLREARRGAQEREALRLHNEELQSQLGEARRAAEALEVARRCGKAGRGRLMSCAAPRSG